MFKRFNRRLLRRDGITLLDCETGFDPVTRVGGADIGGAEIGGAEVTGAMEIGAELIVGDDDEKPGAALFVGTETR